MVKLILVRHDMKLDNQKSRLYGHIDRNISEEGKEQIDKITNYLKDFDIDKIYTTTSSRTKDTVKKLSELKSIEIIAKTKKRSTKIKDIEIRQINTEIGINPREAFYAKKELVDIKDSLNMICGESIMAYPPGIPIISPGEIITYEIINYINLLKDSGAYFTDAQDKKLNKIIKDLNSSLK